ncbi:MAG: tetratricopeptide repeat protein, partial [Planctomycetaceae bacterium]|nr:tetratricopeptide repeat protein [Planctomycetaceae bacterium]
MRKTGFIEAMVRDAHRTHLNLGFLIRTVAIVAVVAIGVAAFHAWQLGRLKTRFREQYRTHRENGAAALAVRYLENYLLLEPEDGELLAELARLRSAATRRPEDVWKLFQLCERCLRIDSQADDIRRMAATTAFQLGRPRESLFHYSRVREAAAGEPELASQIAASHELNHDYDQAEQFYRRAIRLAPSDTRSHERLARLLQVHKQDSSGAADVMDLLVTTNPADPVARLARAEYLRRSGDFDAAAADVTEALHLQPGGIEPCLAAGELLLTGLDIPEISRSDIVRDLEQLMTAVPDDPRIPIMRGLLTLTEGSAAAAAEQFAEALRVHPENERLLMLASLAHIRADAPEKAEALVSVIPRTPQSRSVRSTLTGLIAAQRHQWGTAVSLLEPVVRTASGDPLLAGESALALCRSYEKLNDAESEAAVCRMMVERGVLPDTFRLRQTALLLQQGRLNETNTANVGAGAKEMSPEQAVFRAHLLVRQQQRRRPSERNWRAAEIAIDKAAQLDPKSPEPLLIRMSMLRSTDRIAEALQILEEAVAAFPEDPSVQVTAALFRTAAPAPSDALAELATLEEKFGTTTVLWDAELLCCAAMASTEDVESLRTDLEQQIERLPQGEQFERYRRLAAVCRNRRDHAAALRILQKAAVLDGDRVDLLREVFTAAVGAGNDRVQQETVEKLRQLEGENGVNWRWAEVARRLADGEAEGSGKLQEAATLLGEIRDRRPDWPPLLIQEGMLLEREGRFEDAVARYDAVVSSPTPDPTIVERLIALLYNLGRFDEAAAVLNTSEAVITSGEFDSGNLLSWSALFAARSEDHQRLLELARRRTAAAPEDFRSHLFLGQVCQQLQQLEQAEQEFRAAIRLNPQAPEPWVSLVLLLSRQKRPQDAAAVFQKLKADSAPPPAALAKCAEIIGDSETLNYYQALQTLRPARSEDLLACSSYFLRTRRFGEAENILRQLIEGNGTGTPAEIRLARRQLSEVLQMRGPRFRDEAAALLKRNLDELNQADASQHGGSQLPIPELRARLVLAARFPTLDDLATAQNLLTRLSELGATQPSDHMLLAGMLDALGRSADADLRWKSLLSTSGDDPNVRFQYIRRLTARGEYESARTQLVSSAATLPPDVAGGLAAELLEKEQGFAEDMEKIIDAARKQAPSSHRLMVFQALIRDGQGQFDDAVDLYEQALRVSGTDVQALNNLAWMLAVSNRTPDRALDLIQQAIDIAGRQPQLLDTLATVLIAVEKPDQAIAVIRELQSAEDSPERQFLLATALLNSGDRTSAERVLQEALDAGLAAEHLHPAQRAILQQVR